MQPPANFAYHPEITALVGGGSAALNGVDTSILSRPTIYLILVAGQRQEWRARTRADGEAADDLDTVPAAALTKILPLNYHATTNNVIWERVY